ncbi:hypothetical protein SAMN04489760_10112 [Syntrophus gentianae]|uniref:Uncharacterized protein n=1 Tax=Syntrophus gentianae TaxID=43775 RepID=A0A1H7U714_9BACT|nr:hypothetical protein [Syntrophus gentianae]SEL92781.1 hypothetical protein SAMN04489760_10112 [Syntrophus gentianae]
MDNEFLEKLEAISIFEKISDNEEQAGYSASFNRETDGLIKITTDKGEFVYQFKPVQELYVGEESGKNTEEELLSLLYQIERAIKEYDINNEGLTDSSVIMVLEKLSMKPEAPVHDEFMKWVTDYIRMFMSMNNLSRNELRQGINRILRSARRYNKLSGIRGYLNFIRENVP